MSTSDQPTEEELRAAYEAELKKIRVEQILLDQVVSLINLGMRRTGLSPGTEDERDLAQRVTDYVAGMTDRYCIREYTDLEVPRAFAR